MQISKRHILIGVAFVFLIIFSKVFLPQKEKIISEDDFQIENTKEDYIFVHIDGAVLNPGVKEVKEGTRIFELIELAGGALEEADTSRLNLASVLKDEQKVIVPYLITEEASDYSIKYQSNNSSNFININYANLAELQKLSGIGASMAQKIIDYRNENGLFNSIEDIKNVSGIGEAKYNKIKDDITV